MIEGTCSHEGVKTEQCSKCKILGTKTDVIPALGHNYQAVVTPPTCTENGFTTYTSTCDNSSYIDDIVPALGHNYTSAVTLPTCTEGGFTTYTSICDGSSYTDDVVLALGHDFEWIINPDNAAEEIEVCAVCGEKSGETRPIVIECEHTFEWVVTIASNCGTFGEEVEVCSKCGARGATRSIAPPNGCGQQTFYKVTVINGTSDKSEYAEGETVTIYANIIVENGELFKQWSSFNNVTFANAYEAQTTFAMPARNVTVTAEFTTVGIETFAENALTIYPNPVKDELKIKNLELKEGDNIEIYDISSCVGAAIYRAQQHNGETTINVSNLSQGVYIIKIYTGDSVIVRRFVKM